MKDTSNNIQKLPQELINQIAAGEVIERPSSVVKELVDNSIDAGAKHIKIKLEDGGLKLIEVSDDGIGIPSEMIIPAFEAHSTSKVHSLDDLNNLITMGFRGEALSTIVSVSELTATSKHVDSDDAFKVTFEGIIPGEAVRTAREQGTTVSVANIFYNIPARQKYLKTEDTEYRKVLEILIPYFILHPEIHFILEKNGKQTFNLPAVTSESNTLDISRIKEVLKGDFTDSMIELYFDGGGLKISGFIAHPSFHMKRSATMLVFVNNRPITDRGIIRGVLEGYDRYIPHGEKVPFVINIDIDPRFVDVNVHPRKEEVRFVNPYRVYSSIERAVSDAISRSVKDDYVPSFNVVSSDMTNREVAASRLRSEDNFSYQADQPSFIDGRGRSYTSTNSGGIKEVSYGRSVPSFDVQRGLEFSRSLLQDNENDQEYAPSVNIDEIEFINAFQIFKKYIVVELEGNLWVVDQHAAAERITFEKLLSKYEDGTTDVQNLLVPVSIALEDTELNFLIENREFFEKIGFSMNFTESTVDISSMPVEFTGADVETIFADVFELTDDVRDLKRNFDRAKQDILATVACHTSIRTNQILAREECESLVRQLLSCINPYSCPHGRPVVWRMTLPELDMHFDRTY